MTSILVTGATGALGNQLFSNLKKENVILKGTTSRIELANEDLFFFDFMGTEDISNIILKFKPDYIFNLAAIFSNNLNECLKVNFQIPISILESIRKLKLSTRVILIGSAAEYGAVDPIDNPITETHQLLPISEYGVSKSCQSSLIRFYSSVGIDVVGVRIFNLLGESISERLFVGRIQKQILEIKSKERKYIEIGDLSAYRDYLDLKDAVDLLKKIAEKGKTGEIYHLASGEPIRMRDLLSLILAKHELSINIVKEKKAYSNRAGYDVPIIYADMSKTNNLLIQ